MKKEELVKRASEVFDGFINEEGKFELGQFNICIYENYIDRVRTERELLKELLDNRGLELVQRAIASFLEQALEQELNEPAVTRQELLPVAKKLVKTYNVDLSYLQKFFHRGRLEIKDAVKSEHIDL